MITVHLDQNSTLQLHSKIHSWTEESPSRLLIDIRKSRRYHQTAKTSCVSDFTPTPSQK